MFCEQILDAYDVSAGDEPGAARFVQDQLEDGLSQIGIDPISILQTPTA